MSYNRYKINISLCNDVYNNVYWSFLYNADNIDILLNTHVHDIQFAFCDVNCSKLIEFYSNQSYYIANNSYLYMRCGGILYKGMYNGNVQFWIT